MRGSRGKKDFFGKEMRIDCRGERETGGEFVFDGRGFVVGGDGSAFHVVAWRRVFAGKDDE